MAEENGHLSCPASLYTWHAAGVAACRLMSSRYTYRPDVTEQKKLYSLLLSLKRARGQKPIFSSREFLVSVSFGTGSKSLFTWDLLTPSTPAIYTLASLFPA